MSEVLVTGSSFLAMWSEHQGLHRRPPGSPPHSHQAAGGWASRPASGLGSQLKSLVFHPPGTSLFRLNFSFYFQLNPENVFAAGAMKEFKCTKTIY